MMQPPSRLEQGDDLARDFRSAHPGGTAFVLDGPGPQFMPLHRQLAVLLHVMAHEEGLAAPFIDPALDLDAVAEAARPLEIGADIEERHAAPLALGEQLFPGEPDGTEHHFRAAVEPFEIARIEHDLRRIAVGEIDHALEHRALHAASSSSSASACRRSSKRWALPVAVRGMASTKRTHFGHLYTERRAVTRTRIRCSRSAGSKPSAGPTAKSVSRMRSSLPAVPTTMASRRGSSASRRSSISAGLTHWPEILRRSSKRPSWNQ